MTAPTALVLVLAGLLVAYRTERTLACALVEYAAVAVLALLLAFTIATAARTACAARAARRRRPGGDAA
jgi:hypothetical protein